VQPGITTDELATVLVRYKQPDGDVSTEVSQVINVSDMVTSFEATTPQFRWAIAVTEFAEILRHGMYSEGARFGDVLALANGALLFPGPDETEFLELVGIAQGLWTQGE
jgi:Ca-activated chloride channel homolog